jgi:hypothetical protein
VARLATSIAVHENGILTKFGELAANQHCGHYRITSDNLAVKIEPEKDRAYVAEPIRSERA